MKKFIAILAAFMLAASISAQAQDTVDSRILENVQVTAWGGAITTQHTGSQPFFWAGAKNIVKGVRPLAGLEVTKYVTPVVGFSVEGLAMFRTTGSDVFANQTNLIVNGKFNLSNWFGGYKGYPRRVEVVLVPGLGWGHDYGMLKNDRDYLTYNVGTEVAVNLGKTRAVQIIAKPVIMWNNYGTPKGNPLTPTLNHMQARLQVGVSYKFGSRRTGSHNFIYSPYTVTSGEYAKAQKLIDELEAELEKKPTEIIKEIVVEKEVEVTKVEDKYSVLPLTVSFRIGSAKLSNTEKIRITEFVDMVPEGAQVLVIGSADSKTGSKTRNSYLAQERANAVVKVLQANGIENVSISTAFDVDEAPVRSRVAIIEVE